MKVQNIVINTDSVRKAKITMKNAVLVLFGSLCTEGKDGLLGDTTVSKVTHFKQITRFS